MGLMAPRGPLKKAQSSREVITQEMQSLQSAGGLGACRLETGVGSTAEPSPHCTFHPPSAPPASHRPPLPVPDPCVQGKGSWVLSGGVHRQLVLGGIGIAAAGALLS